MNSLTQMTQRSTEAKSPMSPKIHAEGGYLFYFVSHDVVSGEPPHVHIGRGTPSESDAKIWLDPVAVADSGRFRRRDISRMVRMVRERQHLLLEDWQEYGKRLR